MIVDFAEQVMRSAGRGRCMRQESLPGYGRVPVAASVEQSCLVHATHQPGIRNQKPRTRKPPQRAGFSLLELLIAITVLIIIVMIIALVFQQANTAWGSGTRKAGAETTLRAIMGIMEHDLTHAVDATQFGYPNKFSDITDLEFITLDGSVSNRVPQFVHYSYDGKDLSRYTLQIKYDLPSKSWVDDGNPSTNAILNGVQPLSMFTFSTVYAAGMASTGLPLRVEIEAHIQKNETFAIVSGWSAGRGRPGHEAQDKIVASP